MATSFVNTLDEAMKTLVFNKFSSYLGLQYQSSDMVFAPESIAQRMMAEKRGHQQVEFISLWREGLGRLDWQRQRTPVARRGIQLAYDDENQKTAIITAKAVPVNIQYYVYFWSRDLDKLGQIAEKYLFWQHVNPNLLLGYNNTYPMQMGLHFGDVIDISPLSQAYDKGVYFVYKMPIYLEAWILELTLPRTILSIMLDIWYAEGALSLATTENSDLLASYTITNEGVTANVIN